MPHNLRSALSLNATFTSSSMKVNKSIHIVLSSVLREKPAVVHVNGRGGICGTVVALAVNSNLPRLHVATARVARLANL